MSVIVKAAALRKKMGIKRLRSRIPVSAAEKAMVLGLRERGRHRVSHKAESRERLRT